MEISIKEIEENLKSLPKEFLSEVNDYIDFLKHKYFKDKCEIPDWQKNEVRRRVEYSQNNPQSFVSEQNMNNFLNDLELES